MGVYCIRLNILLIISFVFISCESNEENNNDNIDNDFYSNNVAAFYSHYSGTDNILSVYLEFLDVLDINSITGVITHDEQILHEFTLVALDVNANVFIYEEILAGDILSDNIYLYNMDINISFTDESNYSFSSELTTPIDPEIIDYNIPAVFQLDSTNWKVLSINLEAKDLNGFSNIESARYQIKSTLLNGCDTDCIINDNCNEDIIGEEYVSDETWVFDYIESTTDSTYFYSEEILIRPLDGSALYDNEGNIIFSAADCGRTGIVEFKLIVIDKDGLSDEIDSILMEIIQ